MYSWPLRQGLLHYAHETLANLAEMSGATTVESNDLLRAAVERALTEPDGAYSSSMASP